MLGLNRLTLMAALAKVAAIEAGKVVTEKDADTVKIIEKGYDIKDITVSSVKDLDVNRRSYGGPKKHNRKFKRSGK